MTERGKKEAKEAASLLLNFPVSAGILDSFGRTTKKAPLQTIDSSSGSSSTSFKNSFVSETVAPLVSCFSNSNKTKSFSDCNKTETSTVHILTSPLRPSVETSDAIAGYIRELQDTATEATQKEDRYTPRQEMRRVVRVTKHMYLSPPQVDPLQSDVESKMGFHVESDTNLKREPQNTESKPSVITENEAHTTINYLPLQLRLLHLLLSIVSSEKKTVKTKNEADDYSWKQDGGEGKKNQDGEKALQEKIVLVSEQTTLVVLCFMLKTMTAPRIGAPSPDSQNVRNVSASPTELLRCSDQPSEKAKQLALWKELLQPTLEELEPFKMRTGQVIVIQSPTLDEICAYTEALQIQLRQFQCGKAFTDLWNIYEEKRKKKNKKRKEQKKKQLLREKQKKIFS